MLTPQQVLNKLRDFTIDEISTVDAGASVFAELLIAKRDEQSDLTASLDEFQTWIAKSDLDPGASAAQAFEQFVAEQVAKANPTSGDLHHDRPLGQDDKRECASCGAAVPADAPRCLKCKAKVTKAFPPKAKKKKKAKVKAKPTSDVADIEVAADDDADSTKVVVESDEEEDETEPEVELEVDEDPEADPEEEDESSNPFADEDDEEIEEDGPVSEGEEVEDEDFDPSDVELPGDLPQEVGEYIASLESLIEHQEQKMREQEQMTLVKAQDDTKQVDEGDVTFLEEIAKSLNAGDEVEYEDLTKAFGQMADIVKGYEVRATSAETVAKAERDIRITREMTEVVKGWNALALDTTEFPLVLKRCAEQLDEETFDAVRKAFDAANEAAAMGQEISPLFDEVGKRNALPADDDSKIEAAITKRLEAEPTLTRQQAMAKALEADPSLYDSSL